MKVAEEKYEPDAPERAVPPGGLVDYVDRLSKLICPLGKGHADTQHTLFFRLSGKHRVYLDSERLAAAIVLIRGCKPPPQPTTATELCVAVISLAGQFSGGYKELQKPSSSVPSSVL